MGTASDKARYFLEQSVPELKEYQRKKIFSADEVAAIARKRSDFEHKINAQGAAPTDFARYAEFEINVDALRRKRVKRLGIKSTTYNGKRRVFFILDRSVRRHPGDLDLWMQSIAYARAQKAYKKSQEIFAKALRLHPTQLRLWIYAAQVAVEEHGDMTEARSYMQRGLRFCKSQRAMWLEFARLEMSYMAKIHARRQILGIGDRDRDHDRDLAADPADRGDDENVLRLPRLSAADIEPAVEGDQVDTVALENMKSTPATSGAVPMAIFDAAMAHFQDPRLGLDFLDLICEYADLPALQRIADHVHAKLSQEHADSWPAQMTHALLPLLSIPPSSPKFPSTFRPVVVLLREVRSQPNAADLILWARSWLKRLSQTPDLDPAIKTVAESVSRWLTTSDVG